MPKRKLSSLWDKYREVEIELQEQRDKNPYIFDIIRLEQKRDAVHREIKQVAGRKLQRFNRRLNKLRSDQDRKVHTHGEFT